MEYHLDVLTPDQELSADLLTRLSADRILRGMQAARGEYEGDVWAGLSGAEREIATDYYTSVTYQTSIVEASRYVYHLGQLDDKLVTQEIVQ